jgi:2-polyprenyl-3-methyl-5-hydroxy-6-metoxy-1,4-benzoquinol methylase
LRGKRILDVGCGFGRDSKYFSEKGYDVLGVDASEEMIKLAKTHAPKAAFLVQDMLALHLGDRKFDGIWCCASLLHIRKEDAPSVLKGLGDVLDDLGILFISVKRGEGEVLKKYPDGTRRFFANYSDSELKRLVEQNGFVSLTEYVRNDSENDTWISIFSRKAKRTR